MHVIEYDGKALLNFTKKKKALSDSSNYSSNDHEVSQVNLQASFPLEQPLVDMGVTNGGMKFLPWIRIISLVACYLAPVQQ